MQSGIAVNNEGKLPWAGSSTQRGDVCGDLQRLHLTCSHVIVCSFLYEEMQGVQKGEMLTFDTETQIAIHLSSFRLDHMVYLRPDSRFVGAN